MDGSLLLNIRSYRGHNRRLVAISKDGGQSFAAPDEDQALIEPICQGSLIRFAGHERELLFSNPASTKRERLTVRLSQDDGQSWSTAHAKILHEGPAAYSCLAVLPNGEIGCLYECGQKSAYETITFARFTREWLAEPAP
jgi:sialidase-1